jgi:ABC-2 type transport system permease protein
VIWALRQLAAAARLQLRIDAIAPMDLLLTVLQPVVLGVLVFTAEPAPSWSILAGTGFAGLTFVMVGYALTVPLQERMWGTRDSLNLAGGQPMTILGRVAGAFGQGVIGMIIAMAILALLLHRSFGAVAGWLLAATVLLGLAGIYVITALLAIGFARVRFWPGMANGVAPVIILLTGVYTPLDSLPAPLRVLSMALPSAWAMNALRQGAGAAAGRSIGIGVAVLVALAAVTVLAARRLPAWQRRSAAAG